MSVKFLSKITKLTHAEHNYALDMSWIIFCSSQKKSVSEKEDIFYSIFYSGTFSVPDVDVKWCIKLLERAQDTTKSGSIWTVANDN